MNSFQIVSLILAAVGVFLIILAAAGIVRMPDLYSRMQASAKASTLGAMCVLLAVACYFHEESATVFKALTTCFFLLLTAPVSAHILSRAALRSGVPLDPKHVVDELPRPSHSN